MALKRDMLKAMGLTDEQVNAIIDAHVETVDGLKATIDSLKNSTPAPDTGAKANAAKNRDDDSDGNGDDEGKGRKNWRKEAESIKADFERYRQEQETKEQAAKVKAAYRDLLKDAKIDPDLIDTILRATDTSGMELDDDGKLKDPDKLTEGIKSTWGKFIVTEGKKGAKVPPNQGNGGTASKSIEEIMKIEDTNARVQAIAENHELFGF